MKSKILITLLLGIMIFATTPGNNSYAATQQKVLILPFTGASAGKFTYLTQTIRTMLASRLAAKSNIELVDYTTARQFPDTPEKATNTTNSTLFSQYKTDYVISGALYDIQGKLKIQTVISSKNLTPSVHLSTLAENQTKILTTVEDLATDIITRAITKNNATVPATTATATNGLTGFATEHPEKSYKKKWSQGMIISDTSLQIISHKTTKSDILPFNLVSMSIADLDNDGIQEVISCSRTRLVISHFDTTGLHKITEHLFSANYKIHAVNTADLNNDGHPEIYVSANNRSRASSSIFSYTKNRLIQRAANIPWYLRPAQWPGKGLILAGQRGSRDPQKGFIASQISQLTITNDFKNVQATQQLTLPKNVHLFAFAWIQLDREGSPKLVTINQQDRLLVYNGAQQVLWVSDKDFGGSKNFFGLPGQGSRESDGTELHKVFIPSHIVAKDLDNDGDKELLLAQNTRLYGKLFPNFREYTDGTVVCLDWKDDGFRELWKTSTLQGRIADCAMVIPKQPASAKETGPTKTIVYIARIDGGAFLGVALNDRTTLYRHDITIKE